MKIRCNQKEILRKQRILEEFLTQHDLEPRTVSLFFHDPDILSSYDVAREMGSPRRASNRRRRTREGPELCAITHCSGWHTQSEKGEFTSCRGTVQSAWQNPPVSRTTGKAVGCQHGFVVATWYGDDSPHLSLPNSQPCFGGSEEVRQGDKQGW